MSPISHLRSAALAAAVSVALASTAFAAPPEVHPGKGKLSSSFVRGDAASRAAPVVLPQSEREALAERRVISADIVEMQLPEDRIVNLAAVRRADGSVAVGHVDLDAAGAHASHVAAKQEVAGE